MSIKLLVTLGAVGPIRSRRVTASSSQHRETKLGHGSNSPERTSTSEASVVFVVMMSKLGQLTISKQVYKIIGAETLSLM